ncbi:MAG: right-handed parallel beta-helix repeat-containing protein [Candidatus Marinimicrobia bacterium]|nr:right-handed parallel beta-helix repeat-containing protein [Candidatus Neomarinimicrobiota bacterium]
MDSLKLFPQYVNYTGTEERAFINIVDNLRIQGKHDDRPVWYGTSRGCLQVDNDANVYILDFNFNGSKNDTTTIRVKSGSLILENCNFSASEVWAIEVDSGGYLELRNTQFTNLSKGAVQLNGGQVRIFNSKFDQAGKVAILAQGGVLFEAHNVSLTNTMGTGIELNSVTEVWLDSVRVIDSFQDGILLNNCDFTLINQVDSRENGRSGLALYKSKICGIINFSALGNLVNGLDIYQVDTLHILNSEFISNGEIGGKIRSSGQSRLTGIRVGHNGSDGLLINGGEELIIDRASFQTHPNVALDVDSLKMVLLKRVSVVNNGSGVKISNFDSLSLANCLFSANRESASEIRNGNQVNVTRNLIKANKRGLLIENVLNVMIDSNRVESNLSGSDFRSIAILKLTENVWSENVSGAYFSDIGLIQSKSDRWLANSETALEVLSAEEFILTGATMINNKHACLLNNVSAKINSSRLDSSSSYALKLMNSSLLVEESTFHHNNIAIELAEGSRANVVQCEFTENELTMRAQPSVSLSVSFSSVLNSRAGLQIGNYGEVELFSNRFTEIDDYCIEVTGPHLQTLILRQNIVDQTGGIIRSKSNSGKIEIYNNTFSRNISGLSLRPKTLARLDHNIFFNTEQIDNAILKEPGIAKWNCLYPHKSEANLAEHVEDTNLYVDPQFDLNHYLKLQSPCLTGGKNGMLIGALGTLPESRPTLQP